jgi:cyclopropane-fatty-acyl-phospholipid synthase
MGAMAGTFQSKLVSESGRLAEVTSGSAGQAPSVAKELTLRILEGLAHGRELKRVSFRLWDGTPWPDVRKRAATVVLNRPSALKEMLLDGSEAGVGEAYVRGAFNVEGNMESAFELADLIIEQTEGWSKKLKLWHLLHRLPDSGQTTGTQTAAQLSGPRHSTKRDQAAIGFHYDVSNDFYRLWLDPAMAYSCAYFTDPGEDLATAQQNKFGHICRKLALKPGMGLLDIGCGWGGLLLYAARHHGVTGEGITLSRNQLALAQERIREAGLQDRLAVRLLDYRDLAKAESYDAIVSVGMVEHVGRKMLPDYFGQAARLLRPGGLFLNHGIGLGPVPLPENSGSFIQRHVFPDTDLISIGDMLNFSTAAGLEIRDVESLREHYALTLRHWVRNLEAHHPEALEHVNEQTFRVWQLYMAGCAYGFQIGQLSVYQTLLAKLDPAGSSQAPLTRASWYR